MTRKEILEKAINIVSVDRDKQYGSPEDSFALIAKYWETYLGFTGITSKDVAVMMILLKIARIQNGKDHEDNWIDLAGYAACGGEIESEKHDTASIDMIENDLNIGGGKFVKTLDE